MSTVVRVVGDSVDNFLNNFVTQSSVSVAAAVTPVCAMALTIWVLVYGLAVMRKEVAEPINTFAWKAVKMSLIMSFALSSGLYQSEIVGIIHDLEGGLVSALSRSQNRSIFQMVDHFDVTASNLFVGVAEKIVDKLPWAGWMDLLALVIWAVPAALLAATCLGIAVIAKTALAIVLALGPAFIACLAFPATQKYFDAWLGKVLNYTLLTGMLAVAISLSLSLAQKFLKTSSDANLFADAAAFLVVSVTLIFVVKQMPSLAAGLAGGTPLAHDEAARSVKSHASQALTVGASILARAAGGQSSTGSSQATQQRAPSSTPAYRRASLDRMNQRENTP